jgi:hypothetical protein
MLLLSRWQATHMQAEHSLQPLAPFPRPPKPCRSPEPCIRRLYNALTRPADHAADSRFLKSPSRYSGRKLQQQKTRQDAHRDTQPDSGARRGSGLTSSPHNTNTAHRQFFWKPLFARC